jgi:hypothetical protein
VKEPGVEESRVSTSYELATLGSAMLSLDTKGGELGLAREARGK